MFETSCVESAVHMKLTRHRDDGLIDFLAVALTRLFVIAHRPCDVLIAYDGRKNDVKLRGS